MASKSKNARKRRLKIYKENQINKNNLSLNQTKKTVKESHVLMLLIFNFIIALLIFITTIYYLNNSVHIRIMNSYPKLGLLYAVIVIFISFSYHKLQREFKNHNTKNDLNGVYWLKLSRLQIMLSSFTLVVIAYPQLYYSGVISKLSNYISIEYPNIGQNVSNILSSIIIFLISSTVSGVIGNFVYDKIKTSIKSDR